jgi:hypothetical protein
MDDADRGRGERWVDQARADTTEQEAGEATTFNREGRVGVWHGWAFSPFLRIGRRRCDSARACPSSVRRG